jgi:hypothetical protein
LQRYFVGRFDSLHLNGGDVSDVLAEQVGLFEISLGVDFQRCF